MTDHDAELDAMTDEDGQDALMGALRRSPRDSGRLAPVWDGLLLLVRDGTWWV